MAALAEMESGKPEGRVAVATNEELSAFQKKLEGTFSHKGVVGGRLLEATKEVEVAVGHAFDDKFSGHRVLTDSFLEFVGETLDEQYSLNNRIGWPQNSQNYANCLLMFLTMFRSIRASEILAAHGYVLPAYTIRRSVKDQIWVLCAAANKMASFGELFGWGGMDGGDWSQKDEDRVLKKRVQIEKMIQLKLIGEKSGLSEGVRKELLHWERLFNWEAHRGLLSLFRASHQLFIQKQYDLVLGPRQDDLSDSMFLNRSMELNWLALRLLPFMRRYDTPANEDWSNKWNLMEESFRFMFNGFSELSKAIAPAFERLMSAKFKFDTGTYYADPEEQEGKGNRPNLFD